MPEEAFAPVFNQRSLPPIIVGVSGASGAPYAVALLGLLREAGVETHLVLSKAAGLTLSHETGLSPDELRAMASASYDPDDIGAALASGSFKTRGMIVAPCSIRSMSEIASGAVSSLLTRAADVTLKERRRLVLMVRETPLHAGHLRSMLALSEMGAIIAPPMPSFYHRPASIDDLVRQGAARLLDLFDIPTNAVKRWRGLAPDRNAAP